MALRVPNLPLGLSLSYAFQAGIANEKRPQRGKPIHPIPFRKAKLTTVRQAHSSGRTGILQNENCCNLDDLRKENLNKGVDFDTLRQANLDKDAVNLDDLREENLDKD
jgi:hypothetical protein